MFSAVSFLVLITPIVCADYDYYDYDAKDLNVEERPLPPELEEMFQNKTQMELEYEDCMSEYILCFSNSRPDIICAVSRTTVYKSTFRGMCEMSYENCKSKTSDWAYEHDGECLTEVIEGEPRVY